MNSRLTPGGVISGALAGMCLVALSLLSFDVAHVAGAWPYVLFPAMFVLAAAWAIREFRAQGEHARAMERFAGRVEGWEYAPTTLAYRGRLSAFPFGVGRDLRDVDAVRGPFNGYTCASFTHQYNEGKDDEVKVASSWQVDVVDLPYPLATIDLLPEDLLARFAKFLGGTDIDFESAEFNAAWRIMAGDARYAHDIIHPRMMERLLWSDAHGMAIRIEGSAVYAWKADRRGPDDLARRLGVLTAIARLIPDFVYREFKEVRDRLAEAERKREEAAPGWAKTPFALTSGRYTDLGRDEYSKSELPVFEDESPMPPLGTVGNGAGRWDAPPDDPQRVGRA
jgi:hypothetical protein